MTKTPSNPRAPALADEPRLRTWRQWSDWPLTALAGIFFGLYAVQVLYLSAPRAAQLRIEITSWVIWALFVVDYLVRFSLARRRLHFVLHNLFDLLVVALPVLRPGRTERDDHDVPGRRLVGADHDHHRWLW